MTLSAEHFQAVVQSLRPDCAGGAACAGGRAGGVPSVLRARRVRLGGRVTVIPCAGDAARKPLAAVALDLSPTGIALSVPLRMPRGQQFILHIPGVPVASAPEPGAAPASATTLLCTVARWLPAGDGVFTLGAVFNRMLSVPRVAGV